MLRTFIAVKIHTPPELKRVLGRLTALDGPRTVPADSLHLTLKFLGDTREEHVLEIRKAMERAVASEPPFSIRLKGLGAFPSPARPSVLWAGVHDGAPLTRIAQNLEIELVGLGFTADQRGFVPHITLVRFRNRPPDEVFEMLDTEKDSDFGADRIESVICYESQLGQGGPEYSPLATVRLSGAPRVES